MRQQNRRAAFYPIAPNVESTVSKAAPLPPAGNPWPGVFFIREDNTEVRATVQGPIGFPEAGTPDPGASPAFPRTGDRPRHPLSPITASPEPDPTIP